jgi:GNAT superfamily N-acetyltransferase
MNLNCVTYAEEPALKDVIFDAIKRHAWPEFMFHDGVANRLWDCLENDFAPYQFVLKDDAGALVAVGHTLPFFWEEGRELPDGGWDEMFERAVETLRAGWMPNLISAVEASIHPNFQGKGVSRLVLHEMRRIAKSRGFTTLVAPVRPSQKASYPLIPMQHYVNWTNDKGEPFDAWLRTHWRMGATIEKVAPRSMLIEAPVREWEKWTGLPMPESGAYVVAGALAPLIVDRENDCAQYVEPNVWMRHPVRD